MRRFDPVEEKGVALRAAPERRKAGRTRQPRTGRLVDAMIAGLLALLLLDAMAVGG